MAETKSESPDAFDFRRIRRLVKLMDEHGLSEIELRQGETRIKLRRGPQGVVVPEPGASTVAQPVPAAPAPEPAEKVEAAEAHRYVEITSPMVGTFYAASAPDAEPYVQVGSRVEPDTTVCIIEAMKVFNEIPAELTGTIVAILVENGEPLEYGKPLFRVDPGP
jgi:acetyl-CoA carboxylase biotin carboxyl carrier protein